MKKLGVRPYLAGALFTLLLPVFAFFPTFSRAEEQSDAPRKVVMRVVPQYPEIARQMQVQGTVRIDVVVNPAGKMKAAQVLGGHPILVKAAMDAIGKWKWAAGQRETKELIELNFHP
jgi:TonB family protein